MQIRMITTAAGPLGVWPSGTVQVVDDAIGAAFVDGGYAVAVSAPKPIEVATVDVVAETADAPAQAAPKPRRRTKRTSTK
jgi:hypothetical protein